MCRLVHLRLTERALLLLAPDAVQVLKSGTERLNAEPIGVLTQTLTRQRMHLVDTLDGLHRRRRIALRAVADALMMATFTRALNPGGTKSAPGAWAELSPSALSSTQSAGASTFVPAGK